MVFLPLLTQDQPKDSDGFSASVRIYMDYSRVFRRYNNNRDPVFPLF